MCYSSSCGERGRGGQLPRVSSDARNAPDLTLGHSRVQVSLNASIRCKNGHVRASGRCAEKGDSPNASVQRNFRRG